MQLVSSNPRLLDKTTRDDSGYKLENDDQRMGVQTLYTLAEVRRELLGQFWPTPKFVKYDSVSSIKDVRKERRDFWPNAGHLERRVNDFADVRQLVLFLIIPVCFADVVYG